MSVVRFRPVQPEDVVILAQLYDDRTYTSLRDLVWRAQNSRQRGHGLGVVVLQQSKIIGFGLVTLWSKVAEISDLIIHQDLRGQGYGTCLIEYLMTYATQHRKILEIGVRDDNPRAQQLYERLGFVHQRTVQIHFSGKPHDIHYLQKHV